MEQFMRLTSNAFADGATIPRRFTCDGQNLSPPLAWTDMPDGARSLVLLCDDPDAPAGTWHHWAVYDIPRDRAGLQIYLGDEFAELARRNPHDPAISSLTAILITHRATMKCQFDAFADYVAEAEKLGPENYPLYEWTKATIENPAKKSKHVKSFALYVNGNEVYAKEIADALESDLQPMVGRELITRMSRHSTNPADNPQPPARLHN